MATGSQTASWFFRLRGYEQAAIAASFLAFTFLIVDPLVLGAVKSLDREVYRFFRSFTNLGRSNWILIPSGTAILLLAWLRAREPGLRREVIYGYISQMLVYLFAVIALSGLTASLTKNVLGRARPKLFSEGGPVEFQPFAFDADYASFPSGHATTAGALAAVLAFFWPQARVPLIVAAAWVASSRFLVAAHYLSDVAAGVALGVAFAWFLRKRLAARRWLFETRPNGTIALRGRVLHRRAAQALRGRYDRLPLPAPLRPRQ